MIEFEHFQHHIDENAKQFILKELKKQSNSHFINLAYHNPYHFSTQIQKYEVNGFLDDLHKLCDSVMYKVIVMGGEHMDTGHISQSIFQVDDYGNPQFLMVQDTYIRFKIECSNPSFTNVLKPGHVYHYLTRPPTILWLSMDPRYHISVWNANTRPQHTIYPLYDGYLRQELGNRLPRMIAHVG